MWPSVNGNVLTNQIDIDQRKLMTRCKQAQFINSKRFCPVCVVLLLTQSIRYCYLQCTSWFLILFASLRCVPAPPPPPNPTQNAKRPSVSTTPWSVSERLWVWCKIVPTYETTTSPIIAPFAFCYIPWGGDKIQLLPEWFQKPRNTSVWLAQFLSIPFLSFAKLCVYCSLYILNIYCLWACMLICLNPYKSD